MSGRGREREGERRRGGAGGGGGEGGTEENQEGGQNKYLIAKHKRGGKERRERQDHPQENGVLRKYINEDVYNVFSWGECGGNEGIHAFLGRVYRGWKGKAGERAKMIRL
jgi:hypothetical protein